MNTILPPEEWQFWRIPPEERRAAALFELDRQAVMEAHIAGKIGPKHGVFANATARAGKFPPPDASKPEFWAPPLSNWKEYPPPASSHWNGHAWLRKREESKKMWQGVFDRPPLYPEKDLGRWKPRTHTEWVLSSQDEEFPGPWFIADCQMNDGVFESHKYMPTDPAPEDPPNTIARRRLPTIHKGARTNEAEILCALVINKDASRQELVSAFDEWLKVEGVGVDHRNKGQKENDALANLETIALRRLFLASSDRKRACFWVPLRGQKWKHADGTASAFFQLPSASGESSIRDRCSKRFEKLKTKLEGLNG